MKLEPYPTNAEDPHPFMNLAKEESEKSPMRYQLGAVIVKKGRVVAKGYNNYKTHPKFGTRENKWRTLHAECAAVYNALKKGMNPENSVIYVYRKYGRKALPCEHCQKIIKEFGIKKVVYTER